jgi:hypothetical protein
MLKTYAVTVRCESGYSKVVPVEAATPVAACRLAKQVFQAGGDFAPEDPVTALIV